ncbi:hypothetical protein RHOER0001_2997 [Rhodococcus erythropolis SK121]|nr:hypothetical protein RHOER0001_2997 [Rhodococcus erythropolis SK121]
MTAASVLMGTPRSGEVLTGPYRRGASGCPFRLVDRDGFDW